jgi:beta-glucosidase
MSYFHPPGRPWRRRAKAVTASIAIIPLLLTGTSVSSAIAPDPARPWMDTALSPDERAALLLEAMTLEEKVELMTGDQGAAPAAFYNAPITRLGIPELSMADAGAGIADRGWELPGTGGTATEMPSGTSLAASWDPELARAYAKVVTDEARATGHEMLLGPTSDPVRTPFWGRIADTSGEDTFLTSSLTTPFVQEIQAGNVIANLKHYAGYSQEVNRGLSQNAIIGERALHEVWTLPYKDAIEKADLDSVMCSFNKVNDVFACENDVLLARILREQLGFTGFVITDYGAIHSTEPSVLAGTDMETGTRVFYDGALLAAVQEGRVPVAVIDAAVTRILRTMFKRGIFDTEYPLTALPVQEHGQVAREVHEQGVTLLRNRGVLPLSDQRRLRSVALIGGDANITSTLAGASRVFGTYQRPLLDALGDRADQEGINFRYVEGNDPVNAANMIETRDMTAVPSGVLTPENGLGRGLTARHWDNPTFQGNPFVTRTERQLQYDLGFTGGADGLFSTLYASQVDPTPGPEVPVGQSAPDQSAVYTGYITAPTTGTYRLGLTGWGDASLFVDGNLLVEHSSGQRWAEDGQVQLEAGQRVELRVTYRTRPLVQLQPGTLLLQWAPPADAVEPTLQEAVDAAEDADVAVVYVRTYESEERDRVSLKLPQNGDRLIQAVRNVNPNTVVVVASGGPVTMPWRNSVGAVVENYYGGQEEGTALANVLFGDKNPSGHLPFTIPRSEDELGPGQENPWANYNDPNVNFYEGVNVGYRGYIANGVTPAFPFGHGLSYTDFEFDRLRINDLTATGADDSGRVRVRIENTGDRAGTEVVEVYAGPLPGVGSPSRKLVGYAKVDLNEGRRATVRIDIDREDLSYWDASRDRWVTPRGSVTLYVGKSATEVELSGQIRVR